MLKVKESPGASKTVPLPWSGHYPGRPKPFALTPCVLAQQQAVELVRFRAFLDAGVSAARQDRLWGVRWRPLRGDGLGSAGRPRRMDHHAAAPLARVPGRLLPVELRRRIAGGGAAVPLAAVGSEHPPRSGPPVVIRPPCPQTRTSCGPTGGHDASTTTRPSAPSSTATSAPNTSATANGSRWRITIRTHPQAAQDPCRNQAHQRVRAASR